MPLTEGATVQDRLFSHTWGPRPGVQGWMSARSTQGHSPAPYHALNLGVHVGDAAELVARNRAELAQAMGVPVVYLQQVHGVQVVQVQPGMSSDTVKADGAWTRHKQLACAVLVADCLPILLCHRTLPVVGALHAGWRGLCGAQQANSQAGGVVEAFFLTLPPPCADPKGWMAWLGPCIGPRAFEVGVEVREAFVRHDPSDSRCFAPGRADRFLADLAGLARSRLSRLGVQTVDGNDGTAQWCTYQNPERYYSHRHASHANSCTGRMAACIALV